MIDNDPSVVAQGQATRTPVGVTWFLGDACEVATLRSVGTAEADIVAAVTGDDEDNLVVSLLSKQEFAVPRVLARVNNPKNEWMFTDMWGVDVSVSTPHLFTALVEEAVTVGSFVRLLSLEGGKARLAEVTLGQGLAGHCQGAHRSRPPRESTVVAVLREGSRRRPPRRHRAARGRRGVGVGHRRRRRRRPQGAGGLTMSLLKRKQRRPADTSRPRR